MATAKSSLRILHLEDDPRDVELIHALLAGEGYTCDIVRVDTQAAFSAELDRGGFDLIFSDYTIPGFDGFSALTLAQTRVPHIPFIFVSGTIGEESGVITLKAGATDYVLKNRLSRLVPAVRRALREAEQRLQREKAEKELRDDAERLLTQQSALINLTRSSAIRPADFTGTVQHITEVAARTLKVDRVSLWRYAPDRQSIDCIDLYERGADRHASGMALRAEAYPAYFNALATKEMIVADDAPAHPHTRELARDYLEPFGIASLLDVPIYLFGNLEGVLCSEHVGSPRRWVQNERMFAMAVANLVSLLYEQAERWRMEEALRKSDERFQLMARATNDVLRDWDLAADTVWWNEGLRTLFGYCVDEIEAGVESWSSRIHPEDRDGILHDVRGVIESGRRSWSGEYRFRRADGTYAVVMDRGYVLHGDDGKPIRMIASMMDVTERRRVEDALRDNEVRMRAILDTALDAVVVMDAHGRITDWNTQAASMFGWSKAEAVGRTAAELIIPSRYQEAHERGLTRLLSTGDGPVLHRRIELTALRRDGTEFPIELAISPLKIRDSYQFTAFISDITERKQAEDRIREQAALLDIAHDAILVRDLQDQIRFWNQGAERLYGWTAAEAIGRTASDLLYQERPDVLEEARVCLLRTGQWSGHLNQVSKRHGNVVVESRWSLVRDASGTPHSVLEVNTDITEKRLLERKFLQSQRLENLGELAGGIAHDLNNVLTPIMIAVQLLRTNPPDEQSAKWFDAIELCARRGADMLKQVLTFARGVECGHGLFQPKHLLSELETIVKETFPRSIQLRTHVPPDLWSINGDFTQLYQVLLNLCVNARDAMPNGGSLTMEAENVLLDEQAARMHVNARPGPYVVLSVADTGAGIPPHLIEKIFDPFFTTKERGKGTGLGLSTVLGIVKSHNGFVKVYSEVGKGTQMKVFLPAEAADSTPDHDASASEPVDGRGELVLVVDDEASIAEMMKAMLEAHSYRVLTAKDGAEAVGLYAKHVGEVHVVITDMMMPVMDGRATIRALQKLDPGVKIVAVSGLPTNDMIVETIGGSAVPILPKPYSTGKVLTLLRQVLNDQTPTGTG